MPIGSDGLWRECGERYDSLETVSLAPMEEIKATRSCLQKEMQMWAPTSEGSLASEASLAKRRACEALELHVGHESPVTVGAAGKLGGWP